MIAPARWLWLPLLAALLAACGSKVPQVPRLGAADVIVAFGDSLTYGTGAAEHESYPAVLAQLTGRQVVRAGVPGEVTAQSLQRLPEVLAEHKPKLVIVCLGGNDMLRQLGEAEIVSNLRAIVRKVRESGAQAVLVGVPRLALLSSAPKFYEDIAREFGIDPQISLLGLVAMVVMAITNRFLKLPTGLEQSGRSKTAHGAAALFTAILKGRIAVVQSLLNQGVNVNVRTITGKTPLMAAAYKGYGDIIQMLIEHGAELNAKDGRGDTAIKISVRGGYTRISELLKKSGAIED